MLRKFGWGWCGSAGLAVMAMLAGCGDASGDGKAAGGATNAVTAAVAATNAVVEVQSVATNAMAATNATVAATNEVAAATNQSAATDAERLKQELKELKITGEKRLADRVELVRTTLEEVMLRLPRCPDFSKVAEYVSISPKAPLLDFDWWSWYDRLTLKFDFEPATKYKLTLKEGLPFDIGYRLAKDRTFEFTTPNLPQKVEFEHGGRYLPSVGRRVVSVRAVNVTNATAVTYPVPAQNLVQLLAREEGKYVKWNWESKWGSGCENRETAELTHGIHTQTVENAQFKLNERWNMDVDLGRYGGACSNGTYLVEVFGGKPRDKVRPGQHSQDSEYKLVCVTDLALTLRETHGGDWHAWVTSMETGLPLEGVNVRLYSAANVMLSEGVTDRNGRCDCEVRGGERPFAAIAEDSKRADRTFMALTDALDEDRRGERGFLEGKRAEAFVWTDRGIYRHNEKIMAQTILRNHEAKAVRFPVQMELVDPTGETFMKVSVRPDGNGVATTEEFAVPDHKPSGIWNIVVKTPGENSKEIGRRDVKIEEFVPPQIRVKTTVAEGSTLTNIKFTVEGEHLFGGPATELPTEAAVTVKDKAFEPKGWGGYLFGDETRSTMPNYEKKGRRTLDNNGKATFTHEFSDKFKPSAALEVLVQGTVYEKGGRAATARGKATLHEYPAYPGVQMRTAMGKERENRKVKVSMAGADGKPYRKAMKLECRLKTFHWTYSVVKNGRGGYEWISDRQENDITKAESIELDANGEGEVELPLAKTGEYRLDLWNEEENVWFAKSFTVRGSAGEMSSSMANPAKVQIAADKQKYYVGEKPRLTVKAPFTGKAWLQALNRDNLVHTELIDLTNATTEVTLPAATVEWAPSLFVAVTAVQPARARKFTPNRAYGTLTVAVTEREREIPVKVTALVAPNPEGGSRLTAKLDCGGTKSAMATVTVTDEAINMLTNHKTPDPTGWFGTIRFAMHHAHDIFKRLLPVIGDPARKDAKTGGDGADDLFGRVSLQPSRRFKPLSTWKLNVPVKDGKGEAEFDLPEFAGEVRVTAVVCSEGATGGGSAQAKVTPGLVMRPDGPRFMAPEDDSICTLTVYNRGKEDGTVAWEASAAGALEIAGTAAGEVKLEKGGAQTVEIRVKGRGKAGEGELRFTAKGLGEKHTDTILMPVRPAVALARDSVTKMLNPGETLKVANGAAAFPEATMRVLVVTDSGMAELAGALKHLAEYPYGCLEQTTSQIFPLLTAGGALNALPVRDAKNNANIEDIIRSGVERVCSMLRDGGTRFAVWPDTNCEPWDKEVPVWAAHFLAYARARHGRLQPSRWIAERVKDMLRKMTASDDKTVSAYACYALAEAGESVRERALALAGEMEKNPAKFTDIDRSRLAGAYAMMDDRVKAAEIAKKLAPSTAEELAWAILALLRTDTTDARLDEYARRLLAKRDARSGHWQTTGSNAVCLMALAEHFRTKGAAKGEVRAEFSVGKTKSAAKIGSAYRVRGGSEMVVTNAGTATVYASVQRTILPAISAVTSVSNGIGVTRRFLDEKGKEVNPGELKRGDMAVVELTITGKPGREYRDLVVIDMFPACFEPESRYRFDERMIRKEGELSNLEWELRRDMRDDRALIFGKPVTMDAKKAVRCFYAVRVVSKGRYVMPGTVVEAMYEPEIFAKMAPATIEIKE